MASAMQLYTLAAVQTVETGFGNNLSEWNAAYTNYNNGRLNIILTGNIEANFNKLEIFIDSKAGGENVLSGIPEYDFTPDGTNWISSNLGGLTFDSGFEADYHFYMRAGNGIMDVDMADRDGGTSEMIKSNTGQSVYGGGIGDMTSGSVDPGNLGNNSAGDAIQFSIPYAHDNSNTEGIGDDNGNAWMTGAPANQNAALAVTTGFEFSIDVRDLGIDPNVGGTIRVAVFQNGGQHDFVSNQCFEGLPVGTGNLGGDGAGNFTGNVGGVNFNDFEGNQYFSVEIPTPGGFCPPDSYIVFRGVELTGDISDFADSDNVRAEYNPGFVLNSSEAPVWLVFNGNCPSATEIQVESQAGTPGLTLKAEAWNYNTSTFNVLGTASESFNSDVVNTFPITAGNIDSNGNVQSRIGWRKTGFTINFPWVVRVDQSGWNQ